MGGKHQREALRKRELPRERDPRKEKTKGGITHSRRVVSTQREGPRKRKDQKGETTHDRRVIRN